MVADSELDSLLATNLFKGGAKAKSDPLPFRWLGQKGDLCSDTKFVDVDYELLIETKRDIIMRQPEIRDLLQNLTTTVESHPSIAIDSEYYAAIGCDLRNVRRLERLLKSVVDLDKASVLCIAEDSTTFMPVKAADTLVWWSTRLSSGLYHAQGPQLDTTH